jgi:hypothetical protein
LRGNGLQEGFVSSFQFAHPGTALSSLDRALSVASVTGVAGDLGCGHAEQKPLASPGTIQQKVIKGTKIKATALRAEFITTKYTKYSNNLNPAPPKAVPREHSGSGFVYSGYFTV